MYFAVHILNLKTDMVVVVVVMMMMMMMMMVMIMIHYCIIKVAVSSSPLLHCSSQFYVPL